MVVFEALGNAQGLRATACAGKDELIIERCEEGILLRPAFSVPIELYTEERIDEFARDEEAIGQHLPKSP